MRTIPGLAVSRETTERLEHFCSLFLKWSKTMNLSSPSTLDQLWSRHIVDSAQLYRIEPSPIHWIDLGSGGGFPGVIMAILYSESNDGWVDLVESNQKKAAFLRVALMETQARGKIHPVRAEKAADLIPFCDTISARAMADLDQLCGYAERWVLKNDNLRCFFHKGRDYQRELDEARSRWSFDLVEHRSVVETDSVILELHNLRQRRH
ncbi:16S rRNA (guanine(527)-N(7))-methyltransferase RsmG [Oryzifoliimicrobium ureilyticus]|uniref:16S rRNA (guanine(527)-N(7))-methyltransferase RsmG n=1 Tax=Oryzifoliimicrobium ureilyticus TaxID=3113724 RepID=UPI0030766EA1